MIQRKIRRVIQCEAEQDVSGQVVFFKNLPVPNYQSLTAEVHPLPPNFVTIDVPAQHNS